MQGTRGGGKEGVDTGQFYQHRDLYDKCQSCRSCLDKGYLLMPFEERRLPLPWQGTAGPQVKVLFLFAKPSFTKFSPRLSDYSSPPALRAMLDRHYETHAIAFKRRRSVDGSFRAHARRIASLLLETPEGTISDFDDYLFTSLIRCNGQKMPDLKSQGLIASECLGLYGAALLNRLPNLQWIVLVGNISHRLLSLSGVWVKFQNAFRVCNAPNDLRLPPLVGGVSEVVSLNDRLRLIAVPHFSRGIFRAEHYRRIFASWMTRPPLPGGGTRPVLSGAPRAAVPH
ncbi:hypothetical protein EHM92_04815 [bacterium]|nr:MAG: hypothetical protein EHM92_04815 [bacterium]